MAYDMVELLDAVDRAVAAGTGIVSEAAAVEATTRAAELRGRRGFQAQTLLLAIAGGTGTGKSSLLNAIAREPVASVSRLRPHTSRPLAWLPTPTGPAVDDLLDRLEIFERVPQTQWPGVGLIDLPDMDSVAEHHRRTVEDLIPTVDGVVWVFDPAKYGDPSLHSDFLEPLAEYRDQFVFVLNKIDLLDAEDRLSVLDEVRRKLHDDGYPEALIFPIAAAPPIGDPEGLDALELYLGNQLDAKRLAVSKWLIDISRELRSLGEDAGVWTGADIDLRDRWTRDRDAAVAGILPGSGPGSRSDALCRLEDLVAMVAVEVGPRIGADVRDRFPEGVIEALLNEAAQRAAKAGGEVRRKRDAADAGMASARAVLDQEIGDPLRSALVGRARFGAALLEAALRVASIEAALVASTN